MNNRVLSVFFLLTLVFSCKRQAPLVFSSESFTADSLPVCQNIRCPNITIHYCNVIGEGRIADKINSVIKTYITEALVIGDDHIPNLRSISEAASNFIKTYTRHSAEFPNMAAEYFVEIDVSDSYISEEIISLKLQQYQYTGGAHGYEKISFKNMDPKTGLEISSVDLFKNSNELILLVENKFREIHNIPSEGSINATGYWFDNDAFYLPETIGFTKNTMLLIFNQYEIASYADGALEVEISKEEIKEYLKYN
jgi:ribosomal protein S19